MATRTPARMRGFTLLEAMVAVLIVGTLAATSFSLLTRSLSLSSRLQTELDRTRAIGNALEIVQRGNPMLEQEGRINLDKCVVTWSSKPAGASQRNAVPPNGQGPFEVGLFETTVRGSRDGAPWFEFKLEQVGYRRIASGVSSPFGR